jgi:hypothetical protein
MCTGTECGSPPQKLYIALDLVSLHSFPVDITDSHTPACLFRPLFIFTYLHTILILKISILPVCRCIYFRYYFLEWLNFFYFQYCKVHPVKITYFDKYLYPEKNYASSHLLYILIGKISNTSKCISIK